MKLLFSLLFIFFSVHAFANEKFSYSEASEYLNPKLIDILEIQTELESQGYWPLDLSNQQQFKDLGVDQIFFDPYSKKIVLLKFGQKVSDAKLIKKLIQVEGDYLYHGTVADNVPYALYFIGHSEVEAATSVRPFGLQPQASAMNLILPYANASCPAEVARGLSFLSQLGSSVAQGIGTQRIANCGLSVFTGAKSSVNGIAKSVKTFVTDPWQAWKNTKESIGQVVDFVSHLHIEVANLVRSLQGLDADTAMQIGCTIAGELLPGILVSAATGAAIAKAAPLLAARLVAVRKLGPVLLALSARRKAKRLRNAEVTIEQLVSCAI